MQAQTTFVVPSSSIKASVGEGRPAAKAKAKPEKTVHQLHRVNLRSKIEEQGARLIAIDFEKLNGEMRTLVGRKGVTAYLKGGANNVVRDERSYITVFDMQAKEYRTVNLATVVELRCAGVLFRVID